MASASGIAEPRIFTVAGNGYGEPTGERVLAGGVAISPAGVAALPGGGFLLAEGGNVRKVSQDGAITTVAGTGREGFSGDGGPALRARLSAEGVAVLAHGGFLIAGDDRVRRVDPRGVISTVAGNGRYGFAGDGGPAVRAQVSPTAVTALPDGGFLIADRSHNRIREVDRLGIVRTVAGTGEAGFSGDGAPATSAKLSGPSSVAALPEGGFLIADTYNARVRKVDPGGIITTVAGGGTAGATSDGGAATSVALESPASVAVLPGGGFLIADTVADRVREVDRDGTIRTVAGSANALEPVEHQSFASLAFQSGDGSAARRARFIGGPSSVAALPDGGFLVVEGRAGRVRLVTARRRGMLGMALGDPRRDRASLARYATHMLLNRPASVRITVWRGNRRLAQETVNAQRPGWVRVEVRRRLTAGIGFVRVSATARDGARTMQTRAVALGGLLRDSWAVKLAGGDERTRFLGRPARSADHTRALSRPPATRPADIAELPHRATLCRRFERRRVDCEVREEDPYAEVLLSCAWIDEVQLQHDGQIYLSRYRCPTRDHPGLFKRRPVKIREPEVPLEIADLT